MKYIFFALGCVCSLAGFAQSGKSGEMRFQWDSMADTFHRDVQGEYVLNHEAVQGTQIYGAHTKVISVDSEVAGTDAPSVKISVEGSNVYFNYSFTVEDAITHLKESVSYRAQAQFTQGTFADYQAGRPVNLEFTSEGKKAFATAWGTIVTKRLNEQLEHANYAHTPATVTNAQVDGVKVHLEGSQLDFHVTNFSSLSSFLVQ